jgi:hypothetical protein
MHARRPFLILVLGAVAILLGPCLVLLCVMFVRNLITGSELPTRSSTEFSVALTVLGLFISAFLALGYISFVAGMDLLKLRERGRKLASIAMVLWLLICGLIAFVTWGVLNLSILLVAAAALFFFIYLQLRRTRSLFTD